MATEQPVITRATFDEVILPIYAPADVYKRQFMGWAKKRHIHGSHQDDSSSALVD